jgi:hypothetical protein
MCFLKVWNAQIKYRSVRSCALPGAGLLTRSATTIFGSLIQYFVREFGYDALHIKGMPYDWRLSPDMLEVLCGNWARAPLAAAKRMRYMGTGHGRHRTYYVCLCGQARDGYYMRIKKRIEAIVELNRLVSPACFCYQRLGLYLSSWY